MSNDLVVSLVPGPGVTGNAELFDWIKDHGVDPMDCNRLEVFQDDCIAYQYERNEEGDKFFKNKERSIPAEKEPFRFNRKRPIPDVG